jgi:hypothetical protein
LRGGYYERIFEAGECPKSIFAGNKNSFKKTKLCCSVRLVHKTPVILFCLLFPFSLHAQIDSGGGVSSLGAGQNHSSIGSAYATDGSAAGLIEILYPDVPPLGQAADSDSDGLPDSWEDQNFGNLGFGAGADSDGDGTTNLMEYLAGTNPGSAASAFRPASHTSGGNLVLRVPTVPGRSYRVWGTGNLHGAWTPHDTITGDGSTVEWTYPLNQSPRYFLRVEILIP